MKHIFVINPKAGKKDITKEITKIMNKYIDKDDTYLYVTTKPLDAKDFVKNCCLKHPNETLRFYSCGGDGTLNEVANGAVGFKNVEVACYPSGSGNDFVKYFGSKDAFLNIENLINGQAQEVDLIKINDRYVLNIFNAGFDADVVVRLGKYRKLPLVSGKGAYILSLIGSFFRRMSHELKITVDGKILFDGSGVLSAVSNGICYGGGFYCTPNAKVDDALVDVVAVKKISRFKFLKLIKYYKAGTHLDNPKLKEFISYTQGKHVIIESSEVLNYAMDGELGSSNKVELSIVPKALKFVVPATLIKNK